MKLSVHLAYLRPIALLCAPLLIGAISPAAAIATPTLDPMTPETPASPEDDVLQEVVNIFMKIDFEVDKTGNSLEPETVEPMLLDFNSKPELTESILKASTISFADLNRAKNLARQAAEVEHGGLSQYRAEASMHGPPEASPYVDNGDGTITFSFAGFRPGEARPSVHTVVTVDLRSWKAVVETSQPL